MSKPTIAKSVPTRKRVLSVTIRSDLIDEAGRLGTDISGVLEQALDQEHRMRRRRRRAKNRKAIEAWNAWIEDNGIPFRDRT